MKVGFKIFNTEIRYSDICIKVYNNKETNEITNFYSSFEYVLCDDEIGVWKTKQLK